MRTTLRQERCRECSARILVAPYYPHPDVEYVTGFPATVWDSERQDEAFVGWICEDCAFARVSEGLPGALSGPDLVFHY